MVEDDQLQDALRELCPSVLDACRLTTVYLVGSQARGTARPDSDVDLAVLPREPVDDELALQAEVTAHLEPRLQRAVDVVVLDIERCGLLLLGSLLRDARLVCSADESARVAFEVLAMTRTLDFEIHAAPLRAAGLARAAERH